jgi:hypothetical protein
VRKIGTVVVAGGEVASMVYEEFPDVSVYPDFKAEAEYDPENTDVVAVPPEFVVIVVPFPISTIALGINANVVESTTRNVTTEDGVEMLYPIHQPSAYGTVAGWPGPHPGPGQMHCAPPNIYTILLPPVMGDVYE